MCLFIWVIIYLSVHAFIHLFIYLFDDLFQKKLIYSLTTFSIIYLFIY